MTAAFWTAYVVLVVSILVAAWRQQPTVGDLIRELHDHTFNCDECAPCLQRPAVPCRVSRRLSERIMTQMVKRDSRRRFG